MSPSPKTRLFLGTCWCLATLAFAETSAIPTFECLGLYHSGSGAETCQVHYRAAGEAEWRPALDLVYDARNQEHRGSIVGLRPDTAYEVRLTQGGRETILQARTRSNRFPIGQTTLVASQRTTLEIKESGTETGYHLVTPAPQRRATLDVGNGADPCVVIDANYVIVRGLELTNAARHGILIKPGRHHVVIEDCRIAHWGRGGGPVSFGNVGNMDSAIYADRGAGQLVIQRNLIENPRGASNDWDTGHPAGPQGISLTNSSGGNVIRYNEIVTTEDHGFNDAIGGGANFSTEGSPNRDSDIYGNVIAGVWDDGIESEGANMNVRIWGNHLSRVYQHIATACTSKGPLYIFRNVFGSARRTPRDAVGGAMIKTGSRGEFGGGRKFVFHNTALQPRGAFTVFSGHPDPNTVTRNNIFDCLGHLASSQPVDDAGDYDYDFYNGSERGRAREPHGVRGRMTILPSPHLEYYPAPVTTKVQFGRFSVSLGDRTQTITDPVVTVPNPVIDGGIRLPNFNDDFAGRAPDIGAFEVGRPPLRFGRRAAGEVWAPWELYAEGALPLPPAAP
ncbi:MAG: right-handed parallel beta-helix repeat-containing protein [Verrucomicrobia bacterium]|nr:right-handed parallel beta-helix repeat-containing protein [Verrucomicrobiota bacterium]